MGTAEKIEAVMGDLLHLLVRMKTERMSIQVLRYGAANAASLLADFIILFSLTELAGLNYLASAAVGFMIGSAVNYTICANWVFNQSRFGSRSIEFSGFVLIGAAGLVLNIALLWLFTDVAGLYYLWSRSISAVVGFFAKYAARKFLLFTTPLGAGE